GSGARSELARSASRKAASRSGLWRVMFQEPLAGDSIIYTNGLLICQPVWVIICDHASALFLGLPVWVYCQIASKKGCDLDHGGQTTIRRQTSRTAIGSRNYAEAACGTSRS